ncbi:MAG: autotransporter outer membrane beta-barrel domain-containing protein [Pseudomonadota bacterium]
MDDFDFGLNAPMDILAGDPVSCSGVLIFDIDASEISAPTGSVFNWENTLGMKFQLVIGQIEESAPGFTKEFAETELEVGETTTMTFTIDNSSHRVTIQNVAFVDNFPAGMVIADVPNVTISDETVNKDYGNTAKCTGTINAVAGASTFELSDGTIAYGEICTITVDIMATEGGPLTNVTEELTSCISTHSGATASVMVDDDDDTVDRTKRIITNFMARRAAQIVGREPDLTKRLADGGQSSNGGPVNVMGSGTATNYNLAFATSLRQVAGSSRAAKRKRIGKTGSMMALGAGGTSSQTGSQAGSQKGIQRARTSNSLKDEPTAPDREFANRPLTGIGFWTEGTLSKVDDGTSKSDFDLLYVGADYRFSSGLVVGLLAQFDHTEEEDGTNGFAVKGKGWLAGPYVVARLGTNLILDARAAWGRSDNEVSPYNTYADEFKGRRKLLRGRLTGDFKFGALHVAPHIGVVYYEEEQKTYTDSLGNTISSQKVELGRLTFGPKLSTTFTRPDGATVTPHVAVHGIWDFRRTDLVNIDTGLALTGTDDFRARAQAGVTARRADGMAITAEGFYDGIGANGFNAYGGTLRFDVPF